MSAKVIQLHRPRTFTRAEDLIGEVREALLRMKYTRTQLATKCDVSPSTITNLAIGKTRWPRPTTLFPLIDALGLELQLVKKGGK